MVEAAAGLEPFRENVLQAQRKLKRILGQEESVTKLLQSAEQTLNYWREQYSKYQKKKQLLNKRRFLERELLWAEVQRRENLLSALQTKRRKEKNNLNSIIEETNNANRQLGDQNNQHQALKGEMRNVFEERLNLERGIAENESTSFIFKQLLTEVSFIEPEIKRNVTQLKLLRNENLLEMLENSRQNLEKISEKVKENQSKNLKLEEAVEKITSGVLENRIQLALLQYRKDNAKANLKRIDNLLKEAKEHLDITIATAEQKGTRIAVLRDADEIRDEIGITDGHLAALANITENIERMYESYSKLYLELKEKTKQVAENREMTLEEVKTRTQAWRNVMQNLLERTNLEYQKIMSETLATGEVHLLNGHDIEAAGLEILVGFKGGKPVALDAYTQSGGERTTATMSFLLALQQHVRSPFRAVDEFDIHMDPKNREMVAKLLLTKIKTSATQYIVITPSQITFAQPQVNIITVQNVEGKSVVRGVSR
jgi:chromosome segregation protein